MNFYFDAKMAGFKDLQNEKVADKETPEHDQYRSHMLLQAFL